ncbi:hypothetical protein QVD17_21046 [Tagetes erecta]|uniref:Uncharacterized protein n=1 Tax=Tagetes erecta TaxID=13708 RepID=A0AAD8KQZ8_TARER|nr:hypothetical protein QVD17_21046 [Tagetes erecta]
MPAPAAERLPLSLLRWFTPVAAGLLYIIISHFLLNAGHLNVTGIIKQKEVMVSVVNDTTVSIGGSVDMSYALKKTGRINPIPDHVSYNPTVASLMDHALVSTFSSYNPTGSETYSIRMRVSTSWKLYRELQLVLVLEYQ